MARYILLPDELRYCTQPHTREALAAAGSLLGVVVAVGN